MKSDFLIAINQLCAERGLPREVVLEAVKVALVSAYKRDFGISQNITVKLDPALGKVQVFALKKAVERVEDGKLEVSLAEAQVLNPAVQPGDTVEVEVTPPNFGRIAAQTAKQVILQRIREAERDALYLTYADQEGEIVAGTVQAVEPHAVTLGLGKAEAVLPRSEQIPGERYYVGQRIRSFVYEVQKTTRGPQILLTRASRKMLRRLLELEVPEVFNGIVEIKALTREPGSRSKVAVASLQPGLDPVGACVGMRGTRIQSIVNELNGEKVDVVAWDADQRVFIANALSPAQVVEVQLYADDPSGRTAVVVVPDGQLSLAIGKQGQNARLAAKLTGWRIDIKSATEAAQLALLRAKEEAEARAREEKWLPKEEALMAALAVFSEAHKLGEEAPEPVPVLSGEPAPEPVEMAEEPQAAEELVPEAVATLEEEAPAPAAAEEKERVEEAPEAEAWEGEEEGGGEEEEKEEVLRASKKKARERGRTLVYDEELGEVIAERVRKPGRSQEDWREALKEWQRRSGDKG